MSEQDDSVPAIRVEGEARVLEIDEAVYCREAVLRASYWHTDQCYIFITRPRMGVLSVWIRPKSNGPPIDDAAGDFANSLLDHQLRVEIARESGAVRDLIVAKAFAQGGLLDDAPIGDDRDPVERGRGA